LVGGQGVNELSIIPDATQGMLCAKSPPLAKGDLGGFKKATNPPCPPFQKGETVKSPPLEKGDLGGFKKATNPP